MFYLGFQTFAIVQRAEDEYVCEFVVRYDQCLLSEMLSVFCAGVSYMRVLLLFQTLDMSHILHNSVSC